MEVSQSVKHSLHGYKSIIGIGRLSGCSKLICLGSSFLV